MRHPNPPSAAIPPPKRPAPNAKYDWSKYDQLLGTMDDATLAQHIGCSPSAVTCRRYKIGVKAFIDFTRPDWASIDPLLGTLPDRQLSKQFNTLVSTIALRRKKKGIAPALRPRVNWRPYDDLLGTVSDVEIARMAGCKDCTVRARRAKLSVPSLRETRKTNRIQSRQAALAARHPADTKGIRNGSTCAC